MTVFGYAPSYRETRFQFDATFIEPARLVNTSRYMEATFDGRSFDMSLTQPPKSPVTIPIRSASPTSFSVVPATLTFDPSNWNTPQQVTVQTNAAAPTGNRASSLELGPIQSADPAFDGHQPLSPLVRLSYH